MNFKHYLNKFNKKQSGCSWGCRYCPFGKENLQKYFNDLSINIDFEELDCFERVSKILSEICLERSIYEFLTSINNTTSCKESENITLLFLKKHIINNMDIE